MMMMLDVKSRLLYCAIMKIILVMFALSMSLSNNINAATAGDERKSDVIITIISQPDGCHDIGSRIVHKYESVRVHYTATIDISSITGERGKVVDTSHVNSEPIQFTLGTGRVIEGWERGILGMCEGEKRVLVIPPELGFGLKGSRSGLVPGSATLHVEIILVAIVDDDDDGNVAQKPNVFQEMDVNRDMRITYDEMQFWFIRQRPSIIDQAPAVFIRDDKDKDGSLSWDEFSAPKGNLAYKEAQILRIQKAEF